ncbi:hypothetical protein ASPZODRAFT_129076 [Penicilliopsis zonata CBS 506.65]|uniref:UFSP1/2/DUB catalytic domain-containing protein n=1 Tax=Penicilliopsis zonata CBS 506.65 TaxID=1073090 RepID=A0A1L9SNU6_9EURO|nr:hypothetical protein ASPZODRAFT_129076 [Penicilliopsis zonata CBS 506.65]OJJ48773.1 hypothetical protein ASPZODRAFT_129076 [Penicilliopsis zonata CBS 506.65]
MKIARTATDQDGIDTISCPLCPYYTVSNLMADHIYLRHRNHQCQLSAVSQEVSRQGWRDPLFHVEASHPNEPWTPEDVNIGSKTRQSFNLNVNIRGGSQNNTIGSAHDDLVGNNNWSSKKEILGRALQNSNSVEVASSVIPGTTGPVKKLGRSELGPWAHEKRMPNWLKKLLERGSHPASSQNSQYETLQDHKKAANEISDVIPILASLCQQDNSVQRSFLCSSHVHQILKIPREGGFCGYRNIQMLISFLLGSTINGNQSFSSGLPTIFEIQDIIEKAWDMGFNTTGRIETGGIRGTRKYIGTPEAQAFFQSLGIPCEASHFSGTKELRACDALYQDIAAYFRSACQLQSAEKVFTTELPPIYLQHQGHSMTIVGFEIRDNGSANLLVFDPKFKSLPEINQLITGKTKSPDPQSILKAYRRGTSYFQKYKHLEVLKLSMYRDLQSTDKK